MAEMTFLNPDSGKEDVVNVPDQFVSDPSLSNEWYNRVYRPYLDSGLEAATIDPDHPWSALPDSLARGVYRFGQLANVMQVRLGWDNPENASKDIQDYQTHIDKLPYSENTLKFLEKVSEIHDEKGFWGGLGEYIDAVTDEGGAGALLDVTLESLGIFAPTLAAGIATGLYPPAGIAAASVVMGLGSAATEFGASSLEAMDDYLRETQNTDVSNDKAVTELFQNEEKMDEFTDFAMKRGIPIGLVDALSVGLAGKTYAAITRSKKTAEKVTKTAKAAKKAAKEAGKKAPPVMEQEASMLRKAAGIATEALVVQPGLGGFGEYMGQTVSGQKRAWGEIFTEAAAELLPGAGETALGMALAAKQKRKTARIKEMIKDQEKNEKLLINSVHTHEKVKGMSSANANEIINDQLGPVAGTEDEAIRMNWIFNNDGLNNVGAVFIKNILDEADGLGQVKEGNDATIYNAETVAPILEKFGITNANSAAIISSQLKKRGLIKETKDGGWVYTAEAEKFASTLSPAEEVAVKYEEEKKEFEQLQQEEQFEKQTENKVVAGVTYDSVEKTNINGQEVIIAKNKGDSVFRVYIDDKLVNAAANRKEAIEIATVSARAEPLKGIPEVEPPVPPIEDLKVGEKYNFFTPKGETVELKVSNINDEGVVEAIDKDGTKEIIGEKFGFESTVSPDFVLSNWKEGQTPVGSLTIDELIEAENTVQKKHDTIKNKDIPNELVFSLVRDAHAINFAKRRMVGEKATIIKKRRENAPSAPTIAEIADKEKVVVEEEEKEGVTDKDEVLTEDGTPGVMTVSDAILKRKGADYKKAKEDGITDLKFWDDTAMNSITDNPLVGKEWEVVPDGFPIPILTDRGFAVRKLNTEQVEELIKKKVLIKKEVDERTSPMFIFKRQEATISLIGTYLNNYGVLDSGEAFSQYLKKKGVDEKKETVKQLYVHQEDFLRELDNKSTSRKKGKKPTYMEPSQYHEGKRKGKKEFAGDWDKARKIYKTYREGNKKQYKTILSQVDSFFSFVYWALKQKEIKETFSDMSVKDAKKLGELGGQYWANMSRERAEEFLKLEEKFAGDFVFRLTEEEIKFLYWKYQKHLIHKSGGGLAYQTARKYSQNIGAYFRFLTGTKGGKGAQYRASKKGSKTILEEAGLEKPRMEYNPLENFDHLSRNPLMGVPPLSREELFNIINDMRLRIGIKWQALKNGKAEKTGKRIEEWNSFLDLIRFSTIFSLGTRGGFRQQEILQLDLESVLKNLPLDQIQIEDFRTKAEHSPRTRTVEEGAIPKDLISTVEDYIKYGRPHDLKILKQVLEDKRFSYRGPDGKILEGSKLTEARKAGVELKREDKEGKTEEELKAIDDENEIIFEDANTYLFPSLNGKIGYDEASDLTSEGVRYSYGYSKGYYLSTLFYNDQNKILNRLAKIVGDGTIGQDSFDTLKNRHTYATLHHEGVPGHIDGVDKVRLRKWMGHLPDSNTIDGYIEFSRNLGEESALEVNALFSEESRDYKPIEVSRLVLQSPDMEAKKEGAAQRGEKRLSPTNKEIEEAVKRRVKEWTPTREQIENLVAQQNERGIKIKRDTNTKLHRRRAVIERNEKRRKKEQSKTETIEVGIEPIRSEILGMELNDILLLDQVQIDELNLQETEFLLNKLNNEERLEEYHAMQDVYAGRLMESLDPNSPTAFGDDNVIEEAVKGFHPNLLYKTMTMGSTMRWIKHMLGGDKLLSPEEQAPYTEAYKEVLQDMSGSEMAQAAWANARGFAMPHRIGEKYSEARPALLVGDYMRRLRELTQTNLLSTEGVPDFLRQSKTQTANIGRFSLIIEELSKLNPPKVNEDGTPSKIPQIIEIIENNDGSASIVIPTYDLLLEWTKNKDGEIEYELDENDKPMEAYHHGEKSLKLFLNSLGVKEGGATLQPGETVSLTAEEYNGYKAMRRGYSNALDANAVGVITGILAGSPMIEFDYDKNEVTEVKITEEDTFDSLGDKLWDSVLNYLLLQKSYIEDFEKTIVEATGQNKVYTRFLEDGKEEQVALPDFETLKGNIDEAISKITEFRSENKRPSAKVSNQIRDQLGEMAGQLNILYEEKNKTFEKDKSNLPPKDLKRSEQRVVALKNTVNNIGALQLVHDTISHKKSNPYYISHQRRGKYMFSVKYEHEDGTIQTLMVENEDPQVGDVALRKYGGQKRLEKRKAEVTQQLIDLGYDMDRIQVSNVQPQTLNEIKEFISNQEIPVLERLAAAYGFEDEPTVSRFIDNISNLASSAGAGKILMRRKRGKRGRRDPLLGHATPENIGNFAAKQFIDYVTAVSNAVSSNVFRKARQEILTKLHKVNPELGKYMDNYFKYIRSPEDMSGTIKSITFHMTIGFNISSALVNASQTWIITAPLLKMIVGFGHSPLLVTRTLLKAFRDAIRLSENKMKNLDTYGFNFNYDTMPESAKGITTEAEWNNLKRQYHEGIIQAINNLEQGSNMREQLSYVENKFKGEWGKAFANVVKASAYMFGFIEQVNRITASLAAHRLASSSDEMFQKFKTFTKDQTIYSAEEFTLATATDMLVFKSQYLISKENRPQYFQNPVGNVMTQFMPYTINTLSLWAQALQMTMGRGATARKMSAEQRAVNRKSGSILLGSLLLGTVFVGGAMGMPWGDNLKQIIKHASKAAGGYGFDIEDGMRELLADMGAGEASIDMLMRGALSRITGVDISKRMVINEIVPWDLIRGDLSVAAGPTGAVFVDSMRRAGNAFFDSKEGQRVMPAVRFISSALPIGARNMIDASIAIWDPSEPVRTHSGRVILPNRKLNTLENMVRIIGFSPHTLRQERLKNQLINHLNMSASSKKEYYFSQLARIGEKKRIFYEAGDMDKYKEATKIQENLLRDIGKLNKEAMEEGRPQHLIKLTERTMLNRALQERFGIASEPAARKKVNKLLRGLVTEKTMSRKGY